MRKMSYNEKNFSLRRQKQKKHLLNVKSFLKISDFHVLLLRKEWIQVNCLNAMWTSEFIG